MAEITLEGLAEKLDKLIELERRDRAMLAATQSVLQPLLAAVSALAGGEGLVAATIAESARKRLASISMPDAVRAVAEANLDSLLRVIHRTPPLDQA